MDHAYLPTTGHALAIGMLTDDPDRVGVNIESAHAILAGWIHRMKWALHWPIKNYGQSI